MSGFVLVAQLKVMTKARIHKPCYAARFDPFIAVSKLIFGGK